MDNWEARVEFGIYGRARMGADGMAIWYTKDTQQVRLFVISILSLHAYSAISFRLLGPSRFSEAHDTTLSLESMEIISRT